MKSITSRSLLHPFGWCVVLLVFGSILSGCAIYPICYSGNCVNGRGNQTITPGEKYVGEFRDNKPHGRGTLTLENFLKEPDRYVGEFRDGKMHGQGTYTWPNGDQYVGEYRDGKQHGQGTLTNAAGAQYVGEFRNGFGHGQGTTTYANGAQYVGEYRDNKRHGHGTLTLANGAQYVGEWRDDLFNGQGTFTKADGSVVSGLWIDGVNQEELEMRALETRKTSCTGYGFTPGSDAHAQCVMQLAIAEEAQAASSAEAARLQSAIRAQQAAQAAAAREVAENARRQREAQALIGLGNAISGAGTPRRTAPITNLPSYGNSYSSTLTVPSNQVCPTLASPITKQEIRGANRICYYQ